MPTTRRTSRAATALGLLGLVAALPGDHGRTASAAVVDATIVVGGYEVFASLADAAGPAADHVNARLDRGGDVLATSLARPGEDGRVALAMVTSGARRHRPVRLMPGDRLTLGLAGDAEGERTLSLPPLSAAATAGGSIQGTAPPGTRLTVTAASLDGRFARFSPVADSDGRWSVDPSPQLALAAGASGAAFYAQDDVLWQASWTIHAIRTDAPELPAQGDGAFTGPLAAGATSLWLRMAAGVAAEAVVTTAGGAPRARGGAIAWSGGGAETRLVLRDEAGRPSMLQPGDALTVAFDDGSAYGAVLPDVRNIAVAPAADRVTGVAAPGEAVAVWPIGASAPAVVRADAQGAWEAAVVPSSGTAETAGVDVVVGTAPGVRVRAFPPAVTVLDAVGRAVEGRGVAGERVALAVEDGEGGPVGQTAAYVGSDGLFALALFDAQGGVQPLASGDRIAVAAALPIASFTAAPLLPRARAGRDAVEGSAAPGSTVTVTVAAETRTAVADSGGAWRAWFDEAIDLQPGTAVAVSAANPGGPVQRVAFPVFRASVQSRGSSALVEGPPGLAARIEVARDGAELAAGACAVVRASCTAHLTSPSGSDVALAPGDEVLAIPSDGSPAALDVIELAAHIDRSGSDVAGASPPGENVRVAFIAPPGRPAPQDAVVTADFNGVFDYELGRAEWELLAPGIRADVYYTLPSGHQVFATAVVEQVVLAPGDAGWRGLAEPGAAISGTLRRAGRSVASASAKADTDGTYAAALRAAAGAPDPVAMVPGDVLTVSDGRRRAEIAIEPLVAWFAGGAEGRDDAVVGWSAPERTVRVEHRVLAAPGASSIAVVAGLVDAFGTFSLSGPAVDPDARVEAWVALTLMSGDELRARVVQAGGGPAGWVALPVGWP